MADTQGARVEAASVVRCEKCATKNRVPAVAPGVPHCGKCGAALPWITEADDTTFEEVVESSSIPVLLDLWAPWCGPCRMVSPALEELARRYAGRIKLTKVNVDLSPRTQERFGVQGIPTLIVMRGRDVLARQTGAAPEPRLREWLMHALDLPAT